jgi:hypothetical protein
MNADVLAIDALALVTSCLALFFVARLKSTYFLSSRFFIALANLAYIIVLIQSIAVDARTVGRSTQLYYSMISVTAISLGFASYMMKVNSSLTGFRGLSEFLTRLPRQFIIYLAIIIAWTTFALGGNYGTYDQPLLIANVVLLLSFFCMPVLTFYKVSLGTRDPKAAASIKTISISWALFGLVAFIQAIVPANPPSDFFSSVQSVTQLSNGALFALIAFALREPTVLSRMLVTPSESNRGFYFGGAKSGVVLYNIESDRRRIVEEFLETGSESLDPIFCYVTKSEVPFYRALLQEIYPQEAQQRETRITIRPIESSSLDSISSLEVSKARRELIDFGDLDVTQCKRFVEERHRIDQTGRPPQARVWTLSVDSGKKSILDDIARLDPNVSIVDLAANQNVFSQRLGTRHQSLLGTRILLEFDPVSGYEEVVKEFAGEFVSNVEPVAVFTNLGSPVYKQLQQRQNIRLFAFSSKISTPSRAVEGQVLLPDRDTSLLIDAVDKLVQAHKGRHVAIVIEAFTDLILSQGFEKSYGVLSSIMEMAESGSSTALVLINYTCIDDRVLQGLRGLFRYNLKFGQDGLRSIRSIQAGSLPSDKEEARIDEETSPSWSPVS